MPAISISRRVVQILKKYIFGYEEISNLFDQFELKSYKFKMGDISNVGILQSGYKVFKL